MRSRGLIGAMCSAEVLGMAGFACFAALLPLLSREWRLSGTEAGWISGAYYGGYMAAVPMLVGLTDRIDPRRIYLASQALSGASLLGFGLLADGFAGALLFQALGGIGLAGTYMPGLNALSHHVPGARQSRAVAVYTASFGLGTSLSLLLTGELSAMFGWRAALSLLAAGPLAAFVIVAVALPPRRPAERKEQRRAALALAPALRHPETLRYSAVYAAHNFELFGFRSWLVAFLVFSQSLQTGGSADVDATLIATIVTLIGVGASIAGNEIASRFSRRWTIIAIMSASALIASGIGFAAPLPMPAVIAVCLLYAVTITADSGSITAGLVAAAPAEERGTIMAFYSTVGFLGAFLGPVVFGSVLDLAGATTTLGWGLAFLAMGLGCAVGPAVLLLGGRHAVHAEDRPEGAEEMGRTP